MKIFLVDAALERPLESYDYVALLKIVERVFLKALMKDIVPSKKDLKTLQHRLKVPEIPIKHVSI